jgi:hypothetical protein
MRETTKVGSATLAALDSCHAGPPPAIVGARRYGTQAPTSVRDGARALVERVGMREAARILGVSVGSLARSIAGLQQPAAMIHSIAAKLEELAI